jgi:hypothetical protein
MKSALALAASVCLLAGAAAAKEPGAAGAKRVCRAPEAQLGSHMKRPRICRTQVEWDEIEDARRAAPLQTKAPQPEPWERTRPQ